MKTEVSATAIERELETLLESREFKKSGILRRLLEYLVRSALAGGNEKLTEKAIGVNVFDWAPDFPAIEDSIVRKTKARLRDKLARYYAGEGLTAEIRIALERGSYHPRFMPKAQARAAMPAPKSGHEPRVLLLPLHPVGFQDTDCLADGLLEDLTIALTGGGKIPMVPWTTARHLRNTTANIRECREQTGADVILDGVVRRISDSVFQISLTWVDGLTAVFDDVLREKTGPNETSGAVHKLSRQISERLGAKFSEDIHSQIDARHSENPEARSLYLRAQQANRLGTAQGTRTAFAYLARALNLAPDYAAAHALMADGHIYAGISGLSSPRAEMPLAIESAREALKWAPRLASALAARGGVQFAFQWNLAAAKSSLKNARQLDPTSDTTHFWAEAVVAAAGNPVEAAARMERHAEADSCSAATAYLASTYCYNARNWKRCEHWAKRAIAIKPDYYRPYPFLAGAYLEMDRFAEAQECAETARRVSGPNPYTSGMLGVVLARTGRKAEARAVLKEHVAAETAHASSMGKAVIYSALGENNRACDALEKMITDREPYVAWLHIFPFFDNLREYPRFQSLLAGRA